MTDSGGPGHLGAGRGRSLGAGALGEFAARRAARLKRPLTWLQQWALAVADRRGHNRATIAVANKMARIIWAVWSRDVAFVARPAAA